MLRFKSQYRAFQQSESGSVSVLFAILVIVVLSAAGIAIDHGRSEALKSDMQLALDAAALAGVVAEQGHEVETAKRHFAAIAQTKGFGGAAASFVLGSGEITGTARLKLAMGLANLLGFESVDIGVTSTAARNGASRVCALVLDTSAAQALLVNSGADISASQCEFHVKSTGNPAAVFNAGTNLDTARLCLQGGSILNNGGAHPNLETNCPTASDPYAGTLPDPSSASCDYNGLNVNGGTANLTPGVYCGGVNFNAAPNVNLAPGVYVIKGGSWNVNGGTWTGNGVVFYFADNSIIQFNSGVNVSLKAPTSGTFEGILMFEKAGLSRSPFVVDESKGFDMQGVLYLPSRDTIFNGGSSLVNKKMTLIVNTLILNQTVWDLEPDDATLAASSASSTARLVR